MRAYSDVHDISSTLEEKKTHAERGDLSPGKAFCGKAAPSRCIGADVDFPLRKDRRRGSSAAEPHLCRKSSVVRWDADFPYFLLIFASSKPLTEGPEGVFGGAGVKASPQKPLKVNVPNSVCVCPMLTFDPRRRLQQDSARSTSVQPQRIS